MLGRRFHPRSQFEYVVGVPARRGHHCAHRQPARRERAGLVKHDGVHGAGGLQRSIALEENSEFGAPTRRRQRLLLLSQLVTDIRQRQPWAGFPGIKANRGLQAARGGAEVAAPCQDHPLEVVRRRIPTLASVSVIVAAQRPAD